MSASLVCPSYADLAAFYYVSQEVFRRWRREDARIDVAIAQAKQATPQRYHKYAVAGNPRRGRSPRLLARERQTPLLERTRTKKHRCSEAVISTPA